MNIYEMKASYACLKRTRQTSPLTLRMQGLRLTDKSLIKVQFKFTFKSTCTMTILKFVINIIFSMKSYLLYKLINKIIEIFKKY